MSSIIKGLVDEQGVEETKKLSAREKFKRSMKRAGYDMDAGAKRLQDLLAKQKQEREEFEKKEKEIKEDETLQFASEVTPTVNPHAGVKDNMFRGAIGEGIRKMFETPNESPTDSGYQQGGWRKMNEQEVVEDLRKWFKEKWVRFGPDGKIRGACARGDDSEGKPKCLPQAKAHALGKKGRKYAAAKKRREDPNPERSGPAKNVATKKKSNEGVQENMQANYKNYSTQDLLRMIKTIKRDEIGMKIIKAISNELIRRKEGVAEGLSDISGLMSASKLNNSYIITAELAEGGKKKFRVKAQNERVAIEKFKKHYSMAKIINVEEEGVNEGSKYPRNPASYHLKKYPVPPEQMVRPVKKQKVKPNEKPEQKPEEKLDELKCWPGYSRVQGVPAGAPGSCKKKTNEEHQPCPECGGAMYEVSLMNEKKDACYYKVKSRYKVWPSAYASGALVKCRKKGAKNWGSKSKSNEGQIYSTGGGAGEAQRYYTPKDNLGEAKSNILTGIFKANN